MEKSTKGETNVTDVFDLARFIQKQDNKWGGYNWALHEVKNGRKSSHWIWYIFPQMEGLGHSCYSQFYGIGGLDEACAYLKHPVLGERLREISQALLDVEGKLAVEILGKIDAIKVRSSMTLFDFVSPNDIFDKVLAKYYDGKRCRRTMARLEVTFSEEKQLYIPFC